MMSAMVFLVEVNMGLKVMAAVTGGRVMMELGGRMLLAKNQMEVSVTTVTKPMMRPFHMDGRGVLAKRTIIPQVASDLVPL